MGTMLCLIHMNLLYLRLYVRHIQIQQASAIMHSFVKDQHITTSFKLVRAANQTHDGSGVLDYETCSLSLSHTPSPNISS